MNCGSDGRGIVEEFSEKAVKPHNILAGIRKSLVVYSASVEERETVGCLVDFHDTR
jgi:hypothetical protein